VISRYIGEATYFLVIIGAKSYKSQWVGWEIEKAIDLGKRIIAVKIDREYQTPSSLYNLGTSWAMSFSYNSITTAISNA